MSNYEDAIGRAQAMIDDAVRIGGTALPLKEMPQFLTGLARVQLELASMWPEPQPEVEVEGTDVSAELLIAALADGSLERMLAVALEKSVPVIDEKWAARTAVAVVRDVLRSETPSAASEGDLGGVPKSQKLCNVTPPGNRKGPFCGFLKGHAGDHSWAGMVDPSRTRDSDPMPWPKGYEPDYCGVLDDEGSDCVFPKGHPSSHSWTWGD